MMGRRILLLANIISIIIICAYKFSENMPELFKYGEFIFSISNTISYSILASSCFYLVYKYFPKKDNKKKLKFYYSQFLKN